MENDRNDGFKPRNNFVPVKVGEEIDVTIEAVGEKGDGVAKIKGFVLFVPDVNEGDRVKVRVTKILRKVGFAEKIGEGAPAAEGSEEMPHAPAQAEEDLSQFEGEDSEDFGDTEEEPAEEEKKED